MYQYGSKQISLHELRAQMEQEKVLDEDFVMDVLNRVSSIFEKEPNILYVRSPVTICGDIHGQLFDLFKLFQKGGDPNPQTNRYLFLGDYVDRGYQSVHTFIYLAFLKILDPNSIFLIRGNHEARRQNLTYGFRHEILTTYGNHGLWDCFNKTFDLLPCCAVVDNSVFCVHGGLSPNAKLLQRINLIDRFTDLQDEGVYADLCWSDPQEDIAAFRPNQRGAGCLFGATQTKEFLHGNGLKLVARAHQVAMEGYKWYFDRQLVLVWSAPNYGYKTGNLAAIMKLDGGNEPVFEVFDQDERSDQKPADSLTIEYFV